MLKKKAFTLVEIMVVVVIIGILASLASANFGSSIKKARARNAKNNLIIIHSANLMYKARNGKHCVDVANKCTNITQINSMNGTQTLNIVPNGATYSCSADSGKKCTATGSDFTWTLTLTDAISDTNPTCSGADCP